MISCPVSCLVSSSMFSTHSKQVLLSCLSINRINSGLHSWRQWEQVKSGWAFLTFVVDFGGSFKSDIVLLRVWFLVCNSSLVLINCLIFWLASWRDCSATWLTFSGLVCF